MRGYWHLPALGMVTSFLAITLNQGWLIGLFFCWTAWLYVRKRLGKLPIIVSLAATLFSLFYLPSLETPAPDIPYNGNQTITGLVTSPVHESEAKIEFTLTDDLTGIDFLVTYFGEKREGLHLKHGASCRIDGTPELPEPGKTRGSLIFVIIWLHREYIIRSCLIRLKLPRVLGHRPCSICISCVLI